MEESSRGAREGARAILPLVPAALAFGASFGVLARTAGFGWLAATVMSATTFAGSAQFATVSILDAGGTLAAAVAAALLLNGRYAAISLTVRGLTGGLWRRLGESQLIVDESWAVSLRPDGSVEPRVLVGAGGTLWFAWLAGTLVGALAGSALGDPNRIGLDGAFPALFLALLAPQLRSREAVVAALAGAAIALVLVPVAPVGVPILAAAAGSLVGWKRK